MNEKQDDNTKQKKMFEKMKERRMKKKMEWKMFSNSSKHKTLRQYGRMNLLKMKCNVTHP